MTTLKLSIQERLNIPMLLNEVYQKGGLSLQMLTDAQKIGQKIAVEIEFAEKPDKDGSYRAIKGDEAKKVNLRQVFSFQGGQRMGEIRWDAIKDKGKEMEFTTDEIKLLKDIVERKNTEKGFAMKDAWIVELAKKLNE